MHHFRRHYFAIYFYDQFVDFSVDNLLYQSYCFDAWHNQCAIQNFRLLVTLILGDLDDHYHLNRMSFVHRHLVDHQTPD